MNTMFQIGGKVVQKRTWQMTKEKGRPPEDEATPKSKAMADEAMMNIICDDIATETTAAALRGEAPPPEPVMELPYVGSRAMLRIGQT